MEDYLLKWAVKATYLNVYYGRNILSILNNKYNVKYAGEYIKFLKKYAKI